MTIIVSPQSAEPKRRARGFTLIEVMIAVAIVAILAAVALPGYQSRIRKTSRADATSLLQVAALAQERWRLGATTSTAATTSLSPPCPSSGGCTSERQHCTLAVFGASGTGYTLTANAASSTQLGDTGCTAITLTAAGGTTTYGPGKCWGK